MRIFGDPGVLEEKGRAPDVKEEVLYGQTFDRRKSGVSRGRGGNGWSSDGGGWRAGNSNVDGGKGGSTRSSDGGGGWRAGNSNIDGRGGSSVRWRGNGRGANSSGFSSSGKRPRCYKCNSEDHFIRNCPVEEANHVEEANTSVHITLHLSQRSLKVEALGKGLLDSGCSRTVAGRVWYDEYLKTFSAAELENVKETTSKSVFVFGDGVWVWVWRRS